MKRLAGRIVVLLLALAGIAAITAPEMGHLYFRTITGIRSMGDTDSASAGVFHIINDVTGLPAPSGGRITITESGQYNIADLNIGSDILTFSGSGVLVQMRGPATISGTGTRLVEVINGASGYFDSVNFSNPSGDGLLINNAPSIGDLKINNSTLFASGTCAYAQSGLDLIVTDTIVTGCAVGLRVGNAGFAFRVSAAFDNAISVSIDGAPILVDISTILFSSVVPGATHINVAASAPLSSFGLNNNTFVVDTGQFGVVSTTGSYSTAGMYMSGSTFSGAGTYVSGVTAANQQARFIGNAAGTTAFTNSNPVCFITINGGGTATTLPGTGTYTKLLGTTTSVDTQVFTASNGRCTNASGRTLTCYVISQADGTAVGSATYSQAVYLNGTTLQAPPASGIATAGGTLTSFATRTRVTMADGGFVEPFIARMDAPGTGSLTWAHGSLSVTDCN